MLKIKHISFIQTFATFKVWTKVKELLGISLQFGICFCKSVMENWKLRHHRHQPHCVLVKL